VPEEGKKVFRARLVARFNYLDGPLSKARALARGLIHARGTVPDMASIS
jgi:hypothetical protein